MLGNMCIVIVCDVINFEILKFTLAFLLRRFHAQKSKDKILIILRTKVAFKMKEKALFVIFVCLVYF